MLIYYARNNEMNSENKKLFSEDRNLFFEKSKPVCETVL